MELYERIYNQLIDLVNGKIKEVVITPKEMYELDYVLFHKQAVCDNNGNFMYYHIDGKHNNYADVIRNNFKNELVQTIDPVTNNYIFRKEVV